MKEEADQPRDQKRNANAYHKRQYVEFVPEALLQSLNFAHILI